MVHVGQRLLKIFVGLNGHHRPKSSSSRTFIPGLVAVKIAGVITEPWRSPQK